MKDQTKGMFFILITVLLWSTIEVVTKIVQNDVPTMTISFLRFTLGGLLLLPISISGLRNGNSSSAGIKDWITLVLLSILGITITFSLFHKAIEWISASSVATLVSMVPIFVAPIAFLFLKERIGWVQVAGLLMGGVGMLLIYFSEEPHWRSVHGVLLMVVAVICFSIYSVLMKRLNQKMTARVTTPLSLLIGGILTAPITLIDGAPLFRTTTALGYLQLGWLAFIAVGVAYLLYFFGLEKAEAARGNSLMYLKPLIAGLLAWIFLSEDPSPARIASILLVSVSIYFVIKGPKVLKKESST
jgi:drug/metabolite transporter (DMT)-like permease